MTIVSGTSDAERQKISRDSPIGSALLGSVVGDDVEVDAPIGVRIAIVDDIAKPRPPDGGSPIPPERGSPASLGSDPQDAYTTPPPDAFARRSTEPRPPQEAGFYRSWESRQLPDPREAPRSDVARHLKEIMSIEGPVRVSRAYRLYARACGINRVGRAVRSKLNSALYHLVHQNQVLLEKEGPDDSQINAIARLPETPKVLVRPAGDRTFWEIPPRELAAVMIEERTAAPYANADEIYHKVLACYDVGRLTSNIRTELVRIDCASSDGHLSGQ